MMSFAAPSSIRKDLRKKTRNSRSRLNKRHYFFEALEERLNLSLMFMEVEPNQSATPGDFDGGILAAQNVAHPGLTDGVVDSVTMATTTGLDADFFQFRAVVTGEVHVAVINRGGDPGGDGGTDYLDVRVFRESPLNRDDTADGAVGLANQLFQNQMYSGDFSASADELFYVRVVGDAVDDDANYELRIWNTETTDSFGADNNSAGNAEVLGTVDNTSGLTAAGTITQPDRDFYEFDVDDAGRVSVTLNMPDGTGYPFGPGGNQPTNLGVRVRDAGGTIIATSNGTAGDVDVASFDVDALNVGNTYYVEVYSGSFGQVNSYDLDISIVGAPEGRVTGYVFEDFNQNTFRDPMELALQYFNVNIDIDDDGGPDLTAMTDANGYYKFENLPFGTHRISLEPQPGFHNVYPAEPNSSYVVSINADNLNSDHIDFATVEADFGDAPNSYLTLLVDDGPRHTNRGPMLGSERDPESDGFDSMADGDNSSNTDDEDGVTFTSPIIQGTLATVDVEASGDGLLNAWIDFNGNGAFEMSEQIFTNEPVTATTNSLMYTVPGTVVAGPSYARFRLSTAANLKPFGPAPDGEVEDYVVDILQNTIGISNVSMSEGDSGTTTFTFTVTLSAASTSDISINFATADDLAEDENGDNDYQSNTGSLTFDSSLGETVKTIDVLVNGDGIGEPDETFFVNLSGLTGNAVFSNSQGVGTIINDDSGLSIVTTASSDQAEGDSGNKSFTFNINRIGSTAGTTSVNYSVAGSGTYPTDAADFSGSTSGTVTFNPTVATIPVTISVVGDRDVEEDETFTVMLSGATNGAVIVGPTAQGVIRNDDADLSIAALDASKDEGNSGTTPATDFTFQVTRTGDISGATSVNYAVTASGTNPVDGTDFEGGSLPTGVANFLANESAVTITIPVNGDTVAEADEEFTVTLSLPAGNEDIVTSSATGTIQNDDGASQVSITAPAATSEGNTGTTLFRFTVTRTDGSGAASVDYTVSAALTNPADAVDLVGGFTSGMVMFADSETEKYIDILVQGDTVDEPNEQFIVTLSNPSPTTTTSIGTGTATATILNDDGAGIFGTKQNALGGPVAGVTFELFQDNTGGVGVGVFNPASPFDLAPTGVDTVVRTAVSGADGVYHFGGLPDGLYFIREVPVAGWHQDTPAAPNNSFITVANYVSGTAINVDSSGSATPNGPFTNSRCYDNQFETSADLNQVIKPTRPGLLTIEVIGDPGVAFTATSSTGSLTGLNASLVKVTDTSIASRGTGNRARVDLIVTQTEIDAGKTYSIVATGAGSSPTLLVANSVVVDTARILRIQGSSCGDVIVVRDDPASGGADSDAESIFVGSYSGRFLDFNNGTDLTPNFVGVKYDAAIMNAAFDSPIIAGIQIFGGDGSDIVRIGDGVRQDSLIDGGNGDDLLRSGAGRATIRGGSGSDFIVGGAENDILYGGDGDDFIEGLAGGDRIFGDNGNDRLSGGAGDDPLIRGGNGDDLLSGGIGRDRLIGEVGTDEAYREMNGASSVDIFVSAETINNVATATSGPLDAGETYLGNLIDRFWADTSPSDAFNDTLDEIIGQILP